MKKLIPLLLVLTLLALTLLTGCGTSAAAASDAAASPVSAASAVSSAVSAAAETSAETAPEPSQEAQTGGITITDARSAGSAAEADPAAAAPAAQNATYSDADFEVTGEYLYESYGATLYFVTICNHSEATVSVSANGTAKDADGNLVGAGDLYIDVLGPGEESIGYFYFDNATGVASVEYQLSYSDPWLYQAVLSNLSVAQTLNDNNVTVSVTNNGTVSAQFVEAYALFFDANNQLIDYSETYLTDNDYEIKPNSTISGELDCYADGSTYDHVLVYLTGRSDGSEGETSTVSVTDADFDRTDYLYQSNFGSALYFVVLKNNSAETVSVSGNATALDDSGNSIGASDMSIDVLAPGEESIGYFYFSDADNIAGVDCQLSYGAADYYKPVIGNLSVEAAVNSGNVVISATNNGDYAAEFVEAYVLFFDADGNLVDYNETYLIDDDSEIKPGATISDQVSVYSAFDHVQIYMTGRASDF